MMTEKDIQQQIQRDIEAYNNRIYDGFLPDDIMEIYKAALMIIPPGQHQYDMKYISEMLKKRSDEITILDVGIIINLIYMCPFERIYKSLEDGIANTISLDKVREEYNKKNAEYEKSIQRKTKKLYEIAGLVKATSFNQKLVH